MPQNSWMQIALEEARHAAERGEVPVGAVLVRDNTLLAKSGNRTEELNDPSAHAEMLVIREASRTLKEPRLPGTHLYVTLEPCAMCAAVISFARVDVVYFGAYDPKGGGVEHGPRLFEQPTCHHRPSVYGGIEEETSSTLLKTFFEERRD